MRESEQKDETLSELREVRNRHILLALLIGVCVGVVTLGFQSAVAFVTSVQDSFAVPGSLWQLIVFCGGAGALAGYLAQVLAPEAGGSGIPHVEMVLERLVVFRAVPVFFVKFIGGALSIGSKFSLGREGPTIHLGASVAAELATLARAPSSLREHLIACGAGAGLAAAFNAPLAGFLFIIEELKRKVSSITLGMALLGTVVADAVVRLREGAVMDLRLGDVSPLTLSETPAIVLIALVSTLAGLLCNEAIVFGVKRGPRTVPRWMKGGLAGVLVALSVAMLPAITSDLQGVFDRYMVSAGTDHQRVLLLLGLFLLKLLLTAVCYASGVPGGIFAPMLVQGAFVGFAVSELLALGSVAVPSDALSALLGMTAFFAASVRAPFTGVVLLAEMTDGFDLLLPLMSSALVGYFVAELAGIKPIYERLREISFSDAGAEKRVSVS
jgi:CIC family chloride channel protein